MPNFDKTGPEGKGPLTGLKHGKCQGALTPKEGCFMRKGMQRGGRAFTRQKTK